MGREDLVAWGQSWAINPDENCEGGPNEFPECTDESVLSEVFFETAEIKFFFRNFLKYIFQCSAFTNKTGIFGECLQDDLPADVLEENCKFDYCLDKTAKCGIFGAFATACFRSLGSSLTPESSVCNWAEEFDCIPNNCGKNSIYRPCADPCRDVRTCRDLVEPRECKNRKVSNNIYCIQ